MHGLLKERSGLEFCRASWLQPLYLKDPESHEPGLLHGQYINPSAVWLV